MNVAVASDTLSACTSSDTTEVTPYLIKPMAQLNKKGLQLVKPGITNSNLLEMAATQATTHCL